MTYTSVNKINPPPFSFSIIHTSESYCYVGSQEDEDEYKKSNKVYLEDKDNPKA